MKDKIQVINNVLLEHKTVEERKVYLENLGEEYQEFLSSEDVFLDTRDYTFYSIIRIAGQEWLGENIRYATSKGSYIYDDQLDHLHTHGRLYTKEATKEACPDGWEVPDNKTWMDLLEHLGGYYDSFYDKHIGQDATSVTPKLLKGGSSRLDFTEGGKFHHQSFSVIDREGYYWSTSPFFKDDDETIVYIWGEYGDVTLNEHEGGLRAFSLRCVRPSSSKTWVAEHNKALLQIDDLGTRKEYIETLGSTLEEKITTKKVLLDEKDYTLYSIKKIGEQYWLGENLHYKDSKSLVYNHKTEAEFIAKYGRLYDADRLNESIPKGCRIPSLKDYETLFNHFGLDATLNEEAQNVEHAKAGVNLSQRGNSGFDACYGGIQDKNGEFFSYLGEMGYFWTLDRKWDNGYCHYYVAFDWSRGPYVYHEEHYSPIMASCRVLLDL